VSFHGTQIGEDAEHHETEKQIALLHRKLRNIRSDHIQQAPNRIVKTKPSEVVMEILDIRGMMKNKHLSGSIAEQGLYDFKCLEYV
jgi:putative transposase